MQIGEIPGLVDGEEAAWSARLRFHRDRGDGPCWASGAWCWVLRMVSTILSPLVLTVHANVGGWVVFGYVITLGYWLREAVASEYSLLDLLLNPLKIF